MRGIAIVLIGMAIIFLLVALLIKIITLGRLTPGLLPLNWLKLADTMLLFSMAISLVILVGQKK